MPEVCKIIDVWARGLQAFSGRLDCRLPKRQTTNSLGKSWSEKDERLKDDSSGNASLAVKIIPSD